jgi:hypothetical protein
MLMRYPAMVPLLANAGVPMIFWQMPVAAVALLPIALVESLVTLPIVKQRFGPTAVRVLAANALSTFVGIPIAWIGMLIVNFATTGTRAYGFDTPWNAFQSVVLQASWLVPYENQLPWLIPAATLILLVPYFLVSVFVERWLLRRQFRDVEPRRVSRAAWLANAVSYGGLAAYTAYWLLRAFPGDAAAG